VDILYKNVDILSTNVDVLFPPSVIKIQLSFLINHLSQKLTFSAINFLINQLYSYLAQLIATLKTFRLVKFDTYDVFWEMYQN